MNKELLFSVTKKDFDINYFSGTGAGGQHRNKHQNCVRLKHLESGIITTGQNHRDRKANLKDAFNSMVNNTQFKIWLNRKIYEQTEKYEKDLKNLEKRVDEAMEEKNLRIEYAENFD